MLSGSDDEGRTLQAKRKPEEMLEDFIARAQYLAKHPDANAKSAPSVSATAGASSMSWPCAFQIPFKPPCRSTVVSPAKENVAKIKAPLLIHYAELDQRINDGWPAYEEALKAGRCQVHDAHVPKAHHGFPQRHHSPLRRSLCQTRWETNVEFFKANLSS